MSKRSRQEVEAFVLIVGTVAGFLATVFGAAAAVLFENPWFLIAPAVVCAIGVVWAWRLDKELTRRGE